jgi:hypothetical protein
MKMILLFKFMDLKVLEKHIFYNKFIEMYKNKESLLYFYQYMKVNNYSKN